MKLKKQIINYLIIGLSALAMTACGGGNGGGSSSCLTKQVDSDGDGFYDEIDIAPNDASIPGDFSTPEKILANSAVKKAIKIAKKNDVDIHSYLGTNPPDLTGYYRMESGGGDAVVAVLGNQTRYHTNYYYGTEGRVCTSKKYFESIASNFEPNRGFLNLYSRKNAMLRGDKNHFTYYYPFKTICKGKTFYSIDIQSARLNEKGDIVGEKWVRIKIYGEIATNCGDDISAGYYDTRYKISDLNELEYMCVDGEKAYVPNETWINKDKESCRCTTDIEMVCK